MEKEQGFTLVELLAVIALTSIMLTLGVVAIRNFWLVRSLDGSRHQVSAQLKALQQQSVSESNPIALGAWFRVMTPATDTGSPQWGTVRADPGADLAWGTADDTCTSLSQRRFSGGVQVATASFVDPAAALRPVTKATIATLCKAQVSAAASATDFALFFPRGTSTSGCVSLTQPRLSKPNLYVQLTALTGRTTEITAAQATSCP
jgi:prepilin-type N-terminal cleavage/methylation domain-containing protein